MVVSRLVQVGALGIAGVALAAQTVGALTPEGAPSKGASAVMHGDGAPLPAGNSADGLVLGPVVVSELPPGHRRTSTDRPAATAQTISVEIVGGALSVAPESATVNVADGRAELPQVTVVDARGTLDGWTLCVDSTDRTVRWRIADSDVEVVHGDRAGLRPRSGASGALAEARAGHGGGTHQVHGELQLLGPGRGAPDAVPLDFRVFEGRHRC